MITIIGIDCATQENKTGLARGIFEGGKARVVEVIIGSKKTPIADIIVNWIGQSKTTLLAIDAPLGWPFSLGMTLINHAAGQPIHLKSNEIFSRFTDHEVFRNVGKKPLEVGANFIARTAREALSLLDTIRQKTGEDIPLAWVPGDSTVTKAIEVYPAATLTAHDINVPGYKKYREARRLLLSILDNMISLPPDTSLMEINDDALDAVICILAGADFLSGNVYEPKDIDVAKKEGWIWVRRQT